MDELKLRATGTFVLKKAASSGGLVICYPGGSNCLVVPGGKGEPDPFVEPMFKKAFHDESLSSATKEINRVLKSSRDKHDGDECLSIISTDRGLVLAWVHCVDDLDESDSGSLADALGLPPRA